MHGTGRAVERRGEEIFKIEERRGDAASDLTARIAKRKRIEADCQRLLFRNQETSDGDALSLFDRPLDLACTWRAGSTAHIRFVVARAEGNRDALRSEVGGWNGSMRSTFGSLGNIVASTMGELRRVNIGSVVDALRFNSASALLGVCNGSDWYWMRKWCAR